MKIYYFGKAYSFSHVAALRRFGNKHEYFSCSSISSVVSSVNVENRCVGIVPIENTTGGIIQDTVDTLCLNENSNISIKEELELPVKLFLLSKHRIKLDAIRTVYSHEYPLKRCEEWLKKHIPQAEIERINSTSDAALRVLEENNSCAIGSEEAAKYYGLMQLAHIKTKGKRNITRFLVLSSDKTEQKTMLKYEYRSAFIFELKDRAGALCDALQPLKKYNVSMTRIVSRPDPKREWAYVFFIELNGAEIDYSVSNALKECRKHTTGIKRLGSYPLIKLK